MMFRGGGWCPFCGGDGGGFGGGLLMLLFGLLVLAGVILLIVWAVREFAGGRDERPGVRADRQPWQRDEVRSDEDTAIAVARERYARGEITREELDDMLSALRRPR